MAEDEIVREHYRLDGYGLVQTLEYSEGQGSLACCLQSMGVTKSQM